MKKIKRLAAALEAYLFIKGNPATLNEMQQALEEDSATVLEVIKFLKEKYEDASSGIMLHETGAGWALTTKKEYDAWLSETVGKADRLSSAALETLAAIALREPVTRSEIEKIRGVSSGKTISLLLNKGLIEERGRLNVPGRPIVYGTTRLFLKCTGLSDVSELRKEWENHPREGALF